MPSRTISGLLLRRVCVGFLLAAGGACAALAQTAPGASGNVPTYGPPLAGVCVFDRDMALNTSQAGAAVNQQLQQMAQAAQATLDPQRTSIAKDNDALTAEKAKLAAAVYQKREADLQERARTYAQAVQTKNLQFQQARDKAMDQIAAAVTPLLVSAVTEHRCSVVLERSSIYGANAAMDLTPEVIQKLNTALPTLAISLEAPAPGQPTH